MSEVDEAIEQYRQELVAEATLAKGDLDEIEDHLRELIELLRASQPLAVAIAVARTRLGAPRALAREHARVHGSFGPPLSRWLAISAVALLVPMLVSGALIVPLDQLWSLLGFELVAGGALAVALVAQRGWARPVLFAGAAFWTLPMALQLASYPGISPIWLALHVGIVAFLAPWRRREITRASVALALQTWAVCGATMVLGYQISARGGGMVYVTPAAQVALAAAALATVGGILRARWSALGSLVAAATLALSIEELSHLQFRLVHASLHEVMTFGLLATGAIASLVSGVLLWRHARTRLGSLRDAFAA